MAEAQRLILLLMSLWICHSSKHRWPVLPWRSRDPAELGVTLWARAGTEEQNVLSLAQGPRCTGNKPSSSDWQPLKWYFNTFTLLLSLWIQTTRCRCEQTGVGLFLGFFVAKLRQWFVYFSLFFCCSARILWTEPWAKAYPRPSLHPHIQLLTKILGSLSCRSQVVNILLTLFCVCE